MTRKQRNLAFWILVFSLNLIPLVAQGEQKKPTHKNPPTKSAPAAKPAAEPAGSPKPDDKKPDPAPATPPPLKFDGAAKDFSMKDLKDPDLFKDFDVRVEGGNPDNAVKLMARIFADCKDFLEIKHLDKAPGCGDNAGFMVHDKGGYVACMKAHKDHKDSCSVDGTGSTGCLDLTDKSISGGNARFSMLKLGAVDVQLARFNPDGNEEHRNVCEDFPTKIHHIDQQTIQNTADATAAAEKAARIEKAQAQVKNCHRTEGDLRIAYGACSVLATLGIYESQKECVAAEKLDRYGIQILIERAAHAPVDELDGVVNNLISWAVKHPNECKKAIEPIHQIAKRQAGQKIKRVRGDDESDPLAGYAAANDSLQNVLDNAPCMDTDGKITAMQQNLEINQTEKLGELKGMYSLEYQQQYADLMSNLQDSITDNCYSWEMNPACSQATRNLQNTQRIGQMVNAANMKKAQSNAALCQMVLSSSNGMMAPPQCQQSMGMNGMNGMNGFGYGNIGSSRYGFGSL